MRGGDPRRCPRGRPLSGSISCQSWEGGVALEGPGAPKPRSPPSLQGFPSAGAVTAEQRRASPAASLPFPGPRNRNSRVIHAPECGVAHRMATVTKRTSVKFRRFCSETVCSWDRGACAPGPAAGYVPRRGQVCLGVPTSPVLSRSPS